MSIGADDPSDPACLAYEASIRRGEWATRLIVAAALLSPVAFVVYRFVL